MKITDTKIYINPKDIKMIIIINENTDPESDYNNIAYIFNDDIMKPDPSDDFSIISKENITITNLGFRMKQNSQYCKKHIVKNIKTAELDICKVYGINGRIGTVKNINKFPIPKMLTLTKEEIIEFKKRMKK